MAEDRADVMTTDVRYIEAMQVEPCIAERDPADILSDLEDYAILHLVVCNGEYPTHAQIVSQIRVWLAA